VFRLSKINYSFYNWCIDNNKYEILDRWDYELNQCSPKDIKFSIHKKYYFKCDKDKNHPSQLYLINTVSNMGINLNCIVCNSFGQWCLDNNLSHILNLWDYDKNKMSPFVIPKATHKKYYFKCINSKNHLSELKDIHSYVAGHFGTMNCHQCNSIAQYIIDNFGESGLSTYWDYNKNEKSPWNINKGSHERIWINCIKKDYHDSYLSEACAFSSGVRCPSCGNVKVHKFDSLGWLYPEVFKFWSVKNNTSPYDYSPFSKSLVWWKCENNTHEDYKRIISNSTLFTFKCPSCVKDRTESYLQEKIRKYINDDLGYNTNHEYNCTIIPINPKTKYKLPYDNEICKLKLIIEVHGEQHYLPDAYRTIWKRDNMTPDQLLHQRKLYDRYKKLFALSKGYFYLEIPYWTEKDESYKNLIDDKISEILEK